MRVVPNGVQAPPAGEVPVVKADTAMLSLRSSGHDFNSAIGEVITLTSADFIRA